jgi:hippurate hydrolase
MSESESLQTTMKAWRTDLHQHPEIGFALERTVAKVVNVLRDYGLEVYERVGGCGVVGVLKAGQSERAIGLRADMDALPIDEANDIPHRSRHSGQFHGCGHDGHTAMLLGAANILSRERAFDGTVYFIFQPSEEDGRGAQAMIDDGLFTRFPMQAVYGMHNMPGMPVASFATRAGTIMTSEDTFEIKITGAGGHASMPERLIDPIVIGAEIVTALQTIVSRSLSPRDWGVISVTEFLTDGARNIVPSNVWIRGDCRALSPAVQDRIEQRMRTIVDGVCAAHAASGEVEYRREFSPTTNHPAQSVIATQAAQAVVGEQAVDGDCPACGASEDFARMLQSTPGAFIFIGNGQAGAFSQPLHNPYYDFNDDILITGAQYWVSLVRHELG